MKYFCVLLLLSTVACSPEPTDQTKHYYDLKGFIAAQIKILNQQRPTVSKQMIADGASEQKQIVVTDWAQELELFSQLDLNKPAYILSYKTAHLDSLTYQYTLKPSEKTTVQSLIIRVNNKNQVVDLKAVVKTKNQLYDSEKILTLNCTADKKGNWTIQNYSVRGYQHLTMTNPKQFEVVAAVK